VATTVGFGLGFGLQHQALGIWIGLACGAVVFGTMMTWRIGQQNFHFRPSAVPA